MDIEHSPAESTATRQLMPDLPSWQRGQPVDALQRALVSVWQSLLVRSDIGLEDDFFALGGTRALCGQMFDAVGAMSRTHLRLVDVGRSLTVRTLADLIVAGVDRPEGVNARMDPAPRATATTAPRNILQDQIAYVWEQVLGRTSVGIDEKFAALGGTPELTERMLSAVERLCGQAISRSDVATLLTVRSLADVLVTRLPGCPVLEVQAGERTVRPLFFLHGDLGGGGYYVRELARGLGRTRPVFVLQQHGMHGDEVPATVDAMADDQIARLQAVWPDGPFHLGGHCGSALIALEMARRLTCRGRDVASLLMIEPPLRLHGDVPASPPPRLPPNARRMPGLRGPWLLSHYSAILQDYRYPVHNGRSAVFFARDSLRGALPPDSPEILASLRRIVPRCEMHTSTGTHISALGRHVRGLAATMKDCLERFDSEPSDRDEKPVCK